MSTHQPKDPGKSRKKSKNPKYDPRVWETPDSNKSSIPQAPKSSNDVIEDFPPLISTLPSHNTMVPPPAVDVDPNKDDNPVATDPNNDDNTTKPPSPPVVNGLDAMGRERAASSPGNSGRKKVSFNPMVETIHVGLTDSDSEMEENDIPMPPPPSANDGGATDIDLNTNEGVPVPSDDLFQSNSPRVQPKASFASILKEADNIGKQGKLRFIAPLVTDNGMKKAVIPQCVMAKQADNWAYTLVGYFIGKRPAYPFVNFHANRLWKKYELEDVVMNDQGFFYLKFKNEQGLGHVLENGPWLFNDIPILLQRWHSGMWFEKPKPTKVPLWVNIDVLSYLASVIGIPIAADRYTVEMCDKQKGRAMFARVLVEISADTEIPMFVVADIDGTDRRFRLQYHWIPPRCSHCKIFGHSFDLCSDRPRTVAEMEARMANAKLTGQVGPSGAKPIAAPQGCPSADQDQDGFQVPKRRKRRPKKPHPFAIPKPKLQYIPKKPLNDKGKATVPPSGTSHYTTSPPAPSKAKFSVLETHSTSTSHDVEVSSLTG